MQSPFKRALYWPGTDKKYKKLRKINREKLPCAVPLKEWQTYHQKKTSEKQKMEKGKMIQQQKKKDKEEVLKKKKALERRKHNL